MTAAVAALLAELDLTPKPGLVDREHRGAHRDMDAERMDAGARALDVTFAALERIGRDARVSSRELREEIGAVARAGERVMLRATGGVNTHRGALWSLGLLATAAALEGTTSAAAIAQRAAQLARIEDRFSPKRASHGVRVEQRYGVRGARGEAAAGFPATLQIALPIVRAGGPRSAANALLAVIAQLEDTCLLHRGGARGLQFARAHARRALALGDESALRTFDRALVARGLSPGGSADTLAAALFLAKRTPV